MQYSQFKTFVDQGYNRIPLVREVLADCDTPLSAYLKLANQPFSYLFESVVGGEKWGRYSIIGLPAKERLEIKAKQIKRYIGDQLVEELEHQQPLDYIETYRQQFKVPVIDDMPRMNGGLVGYFGYDTIRYIEPKLGSCPNPDQLEVPDILLLLSDELVVFDNLRGRLYLIVHAQTDGFEQAQQRLDDLQQQLKSAVKMPAVNENAREVSEDDFISGFTEDGFKAAVKKAKQYITDGDVMQVVLSQCMSLPFNADPINLYRVLRTTNPSPYMYYLQMGEFSIVGSSPEILVRLEDQQVTVRPIAGTRPRGKDEAEDQALEKDLLADPKELAEHLMLIDLGRNDVGRVAQIGSVELNAKMAIERYSQVMHIVSNVIGQLKPNMSAIDVLKATFPAGTVSGSPKIRAMQIIDELEPVKRSIYSGAVGYIGWHGDMDTAIAIRTAVIKDKHLYLQAGAGVVYDSVPETEWQETLHKGRAIFKAVAIAESDINKGYDK